MIFSVIVPVYNVEKYIVQCVESIITQEFRDFEIILVDDGSTDCSGAMCDEIQNKYSNVKALHKENGGLSDARNYGVKHACGDYLLFVDSDDYICNHVFAKIEKTIEKNNYPDIVFLECTKFCEDNQVLVRMNDGVGPEVNNLRGNELISYITHLNKFPASACTKAIKKSFFISQELYFKKGILSEDLEWGIRLFLSIQSAAYCSEDYYRYRQGRVESISSTASEKHYFDILNIVEIYGCAYKDCSDKYKKKLVFSLLEYVYRLLILGFEEVSKEKRKYYKERLKYYSFILGTRKDKNSQFIHYSFKILGIGLSSKLMKVYLRLR